MSTDESLIKDFNNKKDKAWKKIYEILSPMIVRYIYRIIEDEPEAQNILHDLLMKIWANQKTFDSIKGLKSYLYACSKNKCIDYLRKKVTEPKKIERLRQLELLNQNEEPEPDQVALTELCNQVKAVIKKLSPKRCQAVELEVLKGMSPDKIAEVMKLDRSTVYKHLRAGHAAIRKKFPKFPLKNLE